MTAYHHESNRVRLGIKLRFKRRSFFRHHWPKSRERFDEICLAETDRLSNGQITACNIPVSIDCNAFRPPTDEIYSENAAHNPYLFDPGTVSCSFRDKLPLTVYKQGAATGETQGTLTAARELYKSRVQESLMRPRKDEVFAYRLTIEWLSPEKPFVTCGDSWEPCLY